MAVGVGVVQGCWGKEMVIDIIPQRGTGMPQRGIHGSNVVSHVTIAELNAGKPRTL